MVEGLVVEYVENIINDVKNVAYLNQDIKQEVVEQLIIVDKHYNH